MCIEHAPDTARKLRLLANEIEKYYALGHDEQDESLIELVKPDNVLTNLITSVVNSLLGAVILKEVPVAGPDRPELAGKTLPRVDRIDYDALAHSVYNI